MLELIGLGIASGAGLFGHVKSKDWVSRRLRYTSIVEKPASVLGLVSGGATAVAVGFFPFVAALPAVIVGLGVGTGVAIGAKQARGE